MPSLRPRPVLARLRTRLLTTATLLAAALAGVGSASSGCSSSPPAVSSSATDAGGPVLAGMYTTTESGTFSSLTFYDDGTYSAHLTECSDEESCFDHGSAAVSADRSTCTLTSAVSGQVTRLPLTIASTSNAATTDVGQAFAEVGDLVSGAPGDGGLVSTSSATAGSGSIVQSGTLGSQGFVAGAPNAGNDSSACPRSALGQSIETTLRSKHAAWENVTWGVACGNYPALVDWPTIVTPLRSASGKDVDFKSPQACTAGSAGCDPDFLRQTCTQQSDCTSGTCGPLGASVSTPGATPTSMCLGDDDHVFDVIYGVITGAKQHVEVSALLLFTGAYASTLRNALTYLNAVAPTDHLIAVHIIGGMEVPFPQSKVDNALKSYTRDIGASPKLQVSVGTYGGPPLSWNHSKIVEADGNIALVGGNHWIEPAYNYPAPVHDTSAIYTGDTAKLALRYHNYIWDYSKAHGSTATLKSTLPVAADAGANDDTDGGTDDGGSGNGALLASIPVIGVGTTGGLPFNGYRDSSGDEGIYALIGAAKTTVRIAQQDIASPLGLRAITGIPVAPGLMNALAAALNRGVDLTIMVSGAVWTNGWSGAQTARTIGDAMMAQGVSSSTLCTKFHFGITRDASGALVGHHAKLVIADESAFYMGSQNLYPGGTAGTYIPQLAEFGFIVDDPGSTQSLLSRYWAPLYGDSKGHFISGSEASACIFAPGATPAGDCSSGWLTCGSGGTCAWNGSGYCCKQLGHSASGVACIADGDGTCAASTSGGICSIAATPPGYEFWKSNTHTCTTPDAQACE